MIFAVVSKELIVAEGHYHTSCYHLYTKDEVVMASNYSEGADADAEFEEAENQAYSKDFAYIREELLVNHGIIQMTEQTDRLLQEMNNFLCDRREKLYQEIYLMYSEHEFVEALHIIPGGKGKLLVYPDDIFMDDLIRYYHTIRKNLCVMESST